MQLAKKIGGGSYSTTETFTGNYWVDGKKIYRRCVETTSPSSVDTVQTVYTFSGLSIDKVIKLDGSVQTEGTSPLNEALASDLVATWIRARTSNTTIGMYVHNSAYTSKTVILILEYTKQ